MPELRSFLGYFFMLFLISSNVRGQQSYRPIPLDLSVEIKSPKLESELHHPLPEQYIWGSAAATSQPLYFRKSFDVSATPKAATLYVAGPQRLEVFLNGHLVMNAAEDPTEKIHPSVFKLEVTDLIHQGQNQIAVAAHGQRMVAKILPEPPDVNGSALLLSSAGWKYSTQMQSGWERPDFNDSGWQNAAVLGGIESNIDFFQGNQDAGLYQWPGYDGISPFLARAPVRAEAVLDAFPGRGAFHNIAVLAAGADQLSAPAGDFVVDLPPSSVLPGEHPALLLDFGREITGRLKVISDSNAPMRLAIQYGESLGETTQEPYLGIDELDVAPYATAYGPKSAFRYVKLRFLSGTSPLRFKAIEVDYIYYPVQYKGSFESSDPLLSRIWDVGAYTGHLCMQDDIWDASKRDRMRWMGDLDVSGHVIDVVFADRFLMQQTMDYLIHDAGQPVERDVNGIPGYSAFWVMGEADYYRHVGDLNYLRSIHQPLIQILDYMASELDDRSIFTNRRHALMPYVDWSPGMSGWATWLGVKTRPLQEFAPDVQRGTEFEFYAAFRQGAWLLRQLGDNATADRFQSRASAIRDASLKYLRVPQSGTFGDRWQPNAMAIYSGLADPAETQTIWRKVLSHPDKFRITPYYNFYVISAMAAAGHYQDALNWIRKYWGGMVRRGATSFWEAYYLGLPQTGYHRALQADFGMGYFVSLAHGWSSGPTVWLTERILGIRPVEPGFTRVSIRPELAGLAWARGSEPTPHGPIKVDYSSNAHGHFIATIDLPSGVEAAVSMPATPGEATIQVNDHNQSGTVAEGGQRMIVLLNHAGHYTLTSQSPR